MTTDDGLILTVGVSYWGDNWESDMARELGISKLEIGFWKRNMVSPPRETYTRLLRLAEERHGEIEAATAAIRLELATKFPAG